MISNHIHRVANFENSGGLFPDNRTITVTKLTLFLIKIKNAHPVNGCASGRCFFLQQSAVLSVPDVPLLVYLFLTNFTAY